MAIPIIALAVGMALAGGFGFYQMQQASTLASSAQEAEDALSAQQLLNEEQDSRIAALGSEKDHWQAQFVDADAAVDQLQTSYDSLQADYSRLQNENSALRTQQSFLQGQASDERERRQSAESELSVSATPPYTIIQGRQVSWVFQDSQGNTYSWGMPIDSYRGLIESPEPEEYLTLGTDDGSTITVRDHTLFVESHSFEDVIDGVYDNAGSDYQFLYELWYITSQLATYSTDIGEEPRWAPETFTEAGGDCEDLAILIASMLKASSHTQDWDIQMVYMDADNPGNPEDVDHVILYVETDEFSTFVEATAKQDGLDAWDGTINGWYFDV